MRSEDMQPNKDTLRQKCFGHNECQCSDVREICAMVTEKHGGVEPKFFDAQTVVKPTAIIETIK
jgi:hypothetical protein